MPSGHALGVSNGSREPPPEHHTPWAGTSGAVIVTTISPMTPVVLETWADGRPGTWRDGTSLVGFARAG